MEFIRGNEEFGISLSAENGVLYYSQGHGKFIGRMPDTIETRRAYEQNFDMAVLKKSNQAMAKRLANKETVLAKMYQDLRSLAREQGGGELYNALDDAMDEILEVRQAMCDAIEFLEGGNA